MKSVSSNKSEKDEVALPTDRAFVLQFRGDVDKGGSSYAGRLEHIKSGRVELFYSTEEMCAKLKEILGWNKPDSGD